MTTATITDTDGTYHIDLRDDHAQLSLTLSDADADAIAAALEDPDERERIELDDGYWEHVTDYVPGVGGGDQG